MSDEEKLPHGLLSLLYWLKNSKDVHTAFNKDQLATMRDKFGIPPESPVAQKIIEIGKVSSKLDEVRPLLEALFREHLVDEFINTKPYTW